MTCAAGVPQAGHAAQRVAVGELTALDALCLAASLGVLFLFFRKDLPRTYALERLQPPSAAIPSTASG